MPYCDTTAGAVSCSKVSEGAARVFLDALLFPPANFLLRGGISYTRLQDAKQELYTRISLVRRDINDT